MQEIDVRHGERLPPPRLARLRPRATPRRCGRVARGLDDPRRGAPRRGLRRALLRSCERRLARENDEVRRAGPDPGARRAAAVAARPLGRRLVPPDRRLGLRRQRAARRVLSPLSAADPGAGHARRWPRGRPAGGRLRDRPRGVRGGSGAVHRPPELEPGRRLTRPTLLLLAVSPAAVFFAAPTRERVLLCAGGPSTLPGQSSSRGRGGDHGRRHHAQRRPAAARPWPCCGGGRASAGRSDRQFPPRARAGGLRGLARVHGGETRCASSRCRTPGHASPWCR